MGGSGSKEAKAPKEKKVKKGKEEVTKEAPLTASAVALNKAKESEASIRRAARTALPVVEWSVEDVGHWLSDDVKLPQYVEAFTANFIYGSLLVKLDKDSLKNDLGIGPLGHRDAIYSAIRKLTGADRKGSSASVSASAAATASSSLASDGKPTEGAISEEPETETLKDDSSDKKSTKKGGVFASFGKSLGRKSKPEADKGKEPEAKGAADESSEKGRKRATSNAFASKVDAIGGVMAADKSRTGEGLAELDKLISQITSNDSSLTEVNLNNNGTLILMDKPARDAKMKQLAKALAKNKVVTSLLMVNCAVDDAGATVLCEALEGNVALQSLNLESNQLGLPGVLAVGKMIGKNGVLRELRLTNQKAMIPTEGEAALLQGLEKNQTLTKLNLVIRDATIKENVEKRLTANMDLVRKKRHEERGDSTPVNLSPLQKKIMSIVTDNFDEDELDLSGDMEFTRLKEEEKLAVATGLANNSRIRHLKLVKVQLRDSFAVALGKALATNAKLETLSLDQNSITGAGIIAIAEGLKANTTLKELKMQGQAATATTEAEEALAEMLETNNTLLKLGLQIRSATARDKIDKALRRNSDLMRQKRMSAAPATPN